MTTTRPIETLSQIAHLQNRALALLRDAAGLEAVIQAGNPKSWDISPVGMAVVNLRDAYRQFGKAIAEMEPIPTAPTGWDVAETSVPDMPKATNPILTQEQRAANTMAAYVAKGYDTLAVAKTGNVCPYDAKKDSIPSGYDHYHPIPSTDGLNAILSSMRAGWLYDTETDAEEFDDLRAEQFAEDVASTAA